MKAQTIQVKLWPCRLYTRFLKIAEDYNGGFPRAIRTAVYMYITASHEERLNAYEKQPEYGRRKKPIAD